MNFVLPQPLIEISYLISASLFIIGIKFLGSPATARKGNMLAALGMFLSIVMTLAEREVVNLPVLIGAMLIGSIIGAIAAKIVKMTEMPQMVGLFNGFGGAASALVAIGEFWRLTVTGEPITMFSAIVIILGVLIGAVTLTGSMIAFGKLQGIVSGQPITFPAQNLFNGLLTLSMIGLSGWLVYDPSQLTAFWVIVGLSSLLGVMFVLPIGGADMPVVISLLNSFSGLAAAAAGFVVANNVLIISGALVGASGLILTQIMCKGMNRSLTNVLFSAFGKAPTGGAGGADGAAGDKTYRSVDATEAATILAFCKSLIVVPGYGMAVAQAQHAVKELASVLQNRGVDVKYAIHPVAGRMPGHMNVLLAEADVPYTQLYDMEDINPDFEKTDVALVIGANDVVNPAARTNQGSPIYGMPILNVDKAQNVIVIKRSMNTGFAGIDNELFYQPNTMMYFGNAKEAVQNAVQEIKEL